MSRNPLPRDVVEYGNHDEVGSSSMDHLTLPTNCIQCPYNETHKVPVQDFNTHIFKCRAERMRFYPHTLVLKRCSHNRLHLLPEEELAFHELFCKNQPTAAKKILSAPDLDLDYEQLREAQLQQMKIGKEVENEEKSDIEDSEPEEEDEAETVKRIQMIQFQKDIFGEIDRYYDDDKEE